MVMASRFLDRYKNVFVKGGITIEIDPIKRRITMTGENEKLLKDMSQNFNTHVHSFHIINIWHYRLSALHVEISSIFHNYVSADLKKNGAIAMQDDLSSSIVIMAHPGKILRAKAVVIEAVMMVRIC